MSGKNAEHATKARAMAAAKNLHALVCLVSNDPFLERTIQVAWNVVEEAGMLKDCSREQIYQHAIPAIYRHRQN